MLNFRRPTLIIVMLAFIWLGHLSGFPLVAYAQTTSEIAGKQIKPPIWIAEHSFDLATEKILQEIESGEVSFDEKFAMVQAQVANLPFAQRLPALRRLAFVKNEQIAGFSLKILIREDDPKAKEYVLGRMKSLSIIGKGLVLGEMLNQSGLRSHAYYFSAAEDALQSILNKNFEEQEEAIASAIASCAALLLAEKSDKKSGHLLRQTLSRFPDNPSLWIAVTHSKNLTPSYVMLAQKKLNDKTVDTELRDALMITLSTKNTNMATEYSGLLKGFLNNYAQKDDEAMLKLMKSGKMDLSSISLYGTNLVRLARLRFLQGSDAENIAFIALKSRNPQIRRTILPVVAARYTKRLLLLMAKPTILKQFPLTKKEKEDTLAFIILRYPSYASKARSLLPDSIRIQKRLQRETLIGAFSQGGAFLGL